MGAMALITQALGVQTVLGAFIAGVLVGESPILTKAYRRAAARHGRRVLRARLLRSRRPQFRSDDPRSLRDGSGPDGGARVRRQSRQISRRFPRRRDLARLSLAESLALAIGMNARGSTEVIVASVGLSIGALTSNLYSMIVTMAVLTTCAMPPALRWALRANAAETRREGAARARSLRGQGLRRQYGAVSRRCERSSEWPSRLAPSRPAGRSAGQAHRPCCMSSRTPPGAVRAESRAKSHPT